MRSPKVRHNSPHYQQSTYILHRSSTGVHICSALDEEQRNTFTRPYRSKRSRPCDICRGRKGYCRIDDAPPPPCQRCKKLNVAGTFLEGPTKRQQTSYREKNSLTSVTDQELIFMLRVRAVAQAFGVVLMDDLQNPHIFLVPC